MTTIVALKGPTPKRLPWEDVAPLLRNTNISELSRMTGAHRRSIQRWKREGVSISGADIVASALGCHPVEIWGEQFFQIGTSCSRGHAWEGNEKWSKDRRSCRACEREVARARRARKKVAA